MLWDTLDQLFEGPLIVLISFWYSLIGPFW
jgi:hypothetical protein